MFLGQMTCELILANKYILGGVTAVEVKNSVHSIVQTAKIELPASVVMRNNDKKESIKLADKIKEGDTVKVAFGYNNNNREYFNGYIKAIDRKIPLVIECEDAMYLFARTNLNKSYNGKTVKYIIEDLCALVSKSKGVSIVVNKDVPDIKVANMNVSNKTAFWVIQKLKDWYPMLTIRLVGDVLFCHLLYKADDVANVVKYALNGKNNNTVSIDELKYNTETKTAKVVWEITHENGKVEKKQFGDNNAELVINKKITGQVSDAQLKEFTQYETTVKNYVGFTGKFTAFLMPYCVAGTVVSLEDSQFNRSGKYYIGTVVTTFNNNGGRNEMEIDFKLR